MDRKCWNYRQCPVGIRQQWCFIGCFILQEYISSNTTDSAAGKISNICEDEFTLHVRLAQTSQGCFVIQEIDSCPGCI